MQSTLNKFSLGATTSAEDNSSKFSLGGYSKNHTRLQNQIGFDTLESDLKSTAELVNNTYGGWQDANTMAATKSKVAQMQRRLKAYEQFRNTYAPDSPQNNELISGYNDILSGWDERANEYAKYKNKEDYDKAVKEREEYLAQGDINLGELAAEINNLEKDKETAKLAFSNFTDFTYKGGATEDVVKAKEFHDQANKYKKQYENILNQHGYKNIEELDSAIYDLQTKYNNAEHFQKYAMANVDELNTELEGLEATLKKAQELFDNATNVAAPTNAQRGSVNNEAAKSNEELIQYLAENGYNNIYELQEEIEQKKQFRDEAARTQGIGQDSGLLKSGAFNDGWDFGDLTKTIVATGADVLENVNTAVLEATENLIDTSAYVLGAIGAISENDARTFIAQDFLNTKRNGERMREYLDFFTPLFVDGNIEDYSVLADKADSLVQSGAHLVGQAALQRVGVPYWLTSGVNAFGSEIEGAFQQGAKFGEAGTSGLATAAAEVLSEKLFGGIVSKTGLDDIIAKKFSGYITNTFLRKLYNWGFKPVGKAAGEGFEEVLSEAMSTLGRKMTYESDKTWSELFTSEEALENYVDAFMGGALLGGLGANVENVTNYVNQSQLGQNIVANGGENLIIKTALKLDPKTYAYKLANSANLSSNANIGEIALETQKAVSEAQRKDFERIFEREAKNQGASKAQAKKIANALVENTLSANAKTKMISGDEYKIYKSVADNIVNDVNLATEISQLSQKYDVMTHAISAAVNGGKIETFEALLKNIPASTPTTDTDIAQPSQDTQDENVLASPEGEEAADNPQPTDNDLGFELSAANPKFDAIQDQVEKATGIKHLSEDQKQLRKIGQQFGAKVEFRDLDEIRVVNGQKVLFSPEGEFDPDTNTITLNTNVKDYHNPVQYILKHELTHSLEVDPESYNLLASDILSSKAFNDYVKTKKNSLTGQSFNSSSEWAQDIIDRYKRKGVKMEGDPQRYARNEMVANFVGDVLFGGKTNITENLLNAMQPKVKKTFIEKVKAFFKKLGSIFKGKQLTEIQKLENRFIKTAQKVAEFNEKGDKKTTTEGSGKSYSLCEFEDGQRFVNVETDQSLFDGLDEKGKIDTATKILKTRFQGKVIGVENKVFVNGVTVDEYVHPAKHVKDVGLYEAKLRAAPELDNLMDAGFNFRNSADGKDGHTHKDAVGGFDYFDVIFKVGNEYYQGLINIKNNKRGKLLTDITQIKNITKELTSRYGENPSYAFLRDVSMDNIAKKSPIVNTYSTQESENYSEENKKDKPYSLSEAEVDDVLLALQNGEITTEQAKERLSENRVKTPYEIATTPKEKASWTPELSKPKGEGKGDGESSFYSSSLGSQVITPEIKEQIAKNTYIQNYQTQSNKKTLNLAVKELEEGGSARVNKFMLIAPEKASAVDVAVGIILLEGYQRGGNIEGATKIAEKLREIATASGQTVQMFSIIGRFTPEMMKAYAQRELQKAFEVMQEKQSKKWVEKNKDKFDLTKEDIEYITNHVLMASNLPDGSRTKAILLAEICTRIQNKIPPEKGQSFRALQRISLLLNLKTNVRNILGNATMAPVFIASDFFGNLIDKGIAKKTGVRTTGNFQIKGSGGAIAKGVYESYDDFKRGIRTKQDELNRYEVNQGGGKNFDESHEGKLAKQLNAVAKALNKLDEFTSFCLELGDRPFFEMWFNNSINNQLRLNKVEFPTKEMIDIATQEALQRTWQDSNALTRTMTKLKGDLNKLNIPGTSYGFGDFVLKFVKTPANLGKAMVEFSPLGFIQAAANGVKYQRALEKGQLTPAMQKELVRSTSNAITGTLIYALVALGAAAGIIELSGAGDEDKDVSNFEKYIVGVPPYSMKIFGVDVTYSWSQPLGTVFATVADIMDSQKDDVDSTWGEDLWGAFKTGGKVFTEQSFLTSLYELFSADDLATGVAESVLSEPSAFIPQFISQIASFTDQYQRTTYDATSEWQSALNGLLLKIPGLRQMLPEKVNVLGEKVENVQFLNPWEAFLNPSNTYPESSGAVAEEIYALYKETSNKAVMPRVAPYYFSVKGEKIVFNAEERAEFQRQIGTTSVNILEKMFSSDDYKKLSDEEKVKAVSKVYEYSTAKFKSEYAYDYETLSAMEGEDKQGNPLLSKARYEKIGKDGRRILAQECFLSKEERACKGDYEKLAKLFIRKADKN